MENALETNKICSCIYNNFYLRKATSIFLIIEVLTIIYLFLILNPFFDQIDFFIYEIHSPIASPNVVYIHVPTQNTK